MIAPQKTVIPFYVQFYANGLDVAFSTILRVYTNASIFTVPIHCYDGKLKVCAIFARRKLTFISYSVHCYILEVVNSLGKLSYLRENTTRNHLISLYKLFFVFNIIIMVNKTDVRKLL